MTEVIHWKLDLTAKILLTKLWNILLYFCNNSQFFRQVFQANLTVNQFYGLILFLSSNNCLVNVKEMFHILLLAKDNEGYKNLVKLDSLAYTEGFYYKPRIDLDFLREHSKGLIATSACIGGRIPQYLIEGNYEKAKEYAIIMRDIFGKDDFYIEIQDHGIPEEKMCNPLLVKIAREIGVKVVATNDAHYLEKSDAEAHDVLLCVQTRKTIDDPKRMKFSSDEFRAYCRKYKVHNQ